MQVCVSRIVEEDPKTSVQRTAAAEDIDFLDVWRIISDQSLYPYDIQ
jgi:hypothetical protein